MAEQPQGTGGATWRDMFERFVEIGLGAALLTAEAARKLVDDLVKRGSMTKEEGNRLFHDMMERGKEQKQRLDEMVANMIERALERSDVARRSQFEALEKRVALLEAEVRAHGGKVPPSEGPVQGPTPV